MPETHHSSGYKSHPLHLALVLTDLPGRIHPLMLTPLWLALAAAASWLWAGPGRSSRPFPRPTRDRPVDPLRLNGTHCKSCLLPPPAVL